MTEYESARAGLIEKLSSEIRDKQVLVAMSRVPREKFIPAECRSIAYEDRPLPIGWGQTISQPYIVALMTELLELTGNEKVLEIGTGSGYQTAILAEIARSVVTVERLQVLADKARRTLDALGYTNVKIHLTRETLGWSQGAPYDAIMVTAGAPSIPDELINQLAYSGRMVIPVGTRHMQDLYRLTKTREGNNVEKLGGCRFVSLIGKNAWDG